MREVQTAPPERFFFQSDRRWLFKCKPYHLLAFGFIVRLLTRKVMNQPRRAHWWAIAAGGLTLLVLAVLFTWWRASRALRLSTEEVRSETNLSFLSRPWTAPAEAGFEVVSVPAVFTQAAQFQDRLYVAGPAGLLEYDSSGAVDKEYAVGRELPSSTLAAVAPAVLADAHERELVVATSRDGVLAFNGRSFRQILPRDSDARTITSILPTASGHLLMGTKKRGVLLYD